MRTTWEPYSGERPRRPHDAILLAGEGAQQRSEDDSAVKGLDRGLIAGSKALSCDRVEC